MKVKMRTYLVTITLNHAFTNGMIVYMPQVVAVMMIQEVTSP